MGFVDTVTKYMEGVKFFSLGACPGCADCGLEDVEDMDDPAYEDCEGQTDFTWSPCECCGSSLGGTRYWAHGFVTLDNGKEVLCHFELCYDCFAYFAWDEEPTRECRQCRQETHIDNIETVHYREVCGTCARDWD